MKSILEELFFGKINPSEDNSIVLDEEYHNASTKENELEQELAKDLTPEQIELLDNYASQGNAVCLAVEKRSFIVGFTLGCKIMAAALK